MTSHLDLDALADQLAGVGAGDAHLSTCATCTDRLTELTVAERSVAAVLATLPAPAVPVGLADRITAALAREPAAPGSAPAASPVRSGAPVASRVTPLDGRRRTPPPWLPAVAAGVVLLCGAGLGYALLGKDDPVAGTAASDTAREGAAGPGAGLVRNASGLDYADTAAVTAALPALLAGTAVQTAGAGADPLGGLRDPAALAACLSALLPPEEPGLRPLALDYASYGGEPALAVILPDPEPTRVGVFVVGPDCSQEDSSTLRDDSNTLFFARLVKP